jgi:hypothetical protein
MKERRMNDHEMKTIMMAKTQKTGSPSGFRVSPGSRKAAL